MTDHYFSATPAAPSRRQTVELVLPDLSATLTTDRATFSPDRIDPGTKFLLQDGPPPPSDAAHLLDLGCGYGPIAVTLARRAPAATIWAVDVNERAAALCAANAVDLELANIRTVVDTEIAPGTSVPADVGFTRIYSNPPIRIGKRALHDLLLVWLPRMESDGHAYLVVQKHLGADSLQDWLVEQGFATERLNSRSGYRILDVAARPQETSLPDDAPSPSPS